MTGRWTRRWRKAIGRSDQEARQQQQRLDVGLDADDKPTGHRTAAFDRVQRGSRAVNLQPDAGSVRSVDCGSNGRDDWMRPVKT